MTRRLVIFLLAALFTQAVSDRPVRADEQSSREYEVKAAFIYKFAQFIEWPAGSFSSDTDPVIFATVGDDPFEGSLDRIAAGKTVGARPVVVMHFATVDQIQHCHVLFVGRAQANQESSIMQKLGKSAVLSIGDSDDFCQSGGIIQFIIEDQKIHFEVNTDAADQRGVKISSRLLKLARLYKP